MAMAPEPALGFGSERVCLNFAWELRAKTLACESLAMTFQVSDSSGQKNSYKAGKAVGSQRHGGEKTFKIGKDFQNGAATFQFSDFFLSGQRYYGTCRCRR
ncbi:unnamed protein product [Bursaphelenchus xylophilus]|uniref:(pine wood nematode) hypothetical protein n=1 Tax=Bursaphelenchus xylophilus TaxID=6326 RepID=A0A1I7RU58_BURXY|nr:unnamed protein product [Bursaphelenchus xylophilus]CAG9113838.1 unnamed protein product [Bursaphelenchus xylophilus]